jgi:hypothetical protein
MKSPAKFAGADVEGTNVAGRSRKSFWIASANDDQVFEDDTWTGENDGVGAGRFAAEIFAKIDTTSVAKIGKGFAGGGVKRVKKIHYADEDAGSSSGTPIGQAAVGLCACYAGVEFPEKFASSGIERENFLCGSNAVENAVDD